MGTPVVLVAYASEAGSSARIAGEIASVLRAAGLGVDCRLAADVDALDPYAALVLGSGVYVRSRNADGGGFLTRHGGAVGRRPVWLFSSSPIARGGGGTAGPEAATTVAEVGRAIGARGAAAFGCRAESLDDELAASIDMARVRAWARDIATAMDAPALDVVTA
jgi:menaquinone-dependent protoporphyrinogen oxidase